MKTKDLIPGNLLKTEEKKRSLGGYSPLRKIQGDINNVFNGLLTDRDKENTNNVKVTV